MSIAKGPAAIGKAVRLTGRLRGRTTRTEFWWVALPLNGAMIGFAAADMRVFPDVHLGYLTFTDTAYLATLPTYASLHARRFQDAGQPAVLALGVTAVFLLDALVYIFAGNSLLDDDLSISPFLVLMALAGLFSLVVCLLPSQPGRNRYGPDPHEPATDDLAEVFQ